MDLWVELEISRGILLPLRMPRTSLASPLKYSKGNSTELFCCMEQLPEQVAIMELEKMELTRRLTEFEKNVDSLMIELNERSIQLKEQQVKHVKDIRATEVKDVVAF
uniref:Uncharacterized protein n=1 Tax=Nelumbo nucifera TaxID=4432 RepID=A0A822XPU8_NELNU|nr:TPA_asm: hypothetical protein HUJ06_022674 [Nelumbo nucifera]